MCDNRINVNNKMIYVAVLQFLDKLRTTHSNYRDKNLSFSNYPLKCCTLSTAQRQSKQQQENHWIQNRIWNKWIFNDFYYINRPLFWRVRRQKIRRKTITTTAFKKYYVLTTYDRLLSLSAFMYRATSQLWINVQYIK